MEILEAKRPFLEKKGEETGLVLLNAFYEITGFHLKAYDELQAYFDEPSPYLELELSSAAVIARILDSNSILLVEFGAEDERRRVELPSGKVKKGEDKTIFDTATREFTEETGGIINLPNLKPFAVSPHRGGRGGLQFYAEIRKLGVEQGDELGRAYLTPPEGTDKGRVVRLITEPLDIFLDKEKSLLRNSQNRWAVNETTRLTMEMYTSRLDMNRK